MRDNIFIVFFNIIELFGQYLLYHALIQKRASFPFHRILILTICGIVIGISFVLIPTNVPRIVIFIIGFIFLFRISDLRLSDVFILFILLLTLFYSLQVLATVFTLLPIDEFYILGLLGESFYLLLAILTYWKLPCWRLLRLAIHNLIIKLLFFIICTCLCISLMILNFSMRNVSSYFIYYIIGMLLSGIGIFETFSIMRKYTNEIPDQYHEQDNLVAGLVSLFMAYGNEDLRENTSEFLKSFGKNKFADKLSVNPDNQEGFLENFIKLKQAKASKKEISIISDIAYEKNNQVSQPDTIKIIGILLDNAIEHGTNKHEILISILITEYHFDVEVKNYYTGSGKDIHLMFRQGYSSKKAGAGGYGLNHLWKIVNHLNGKVMVQPLGDTITFKVII